MPRPKKRKTALYVGAAQWKALKQIAAERDMSVAQLVREGIDAVLQKYGHKTVKKRS